MKYDNVVNNIVSALWIANEQRKSYKRLIQKVEGKYMNASHLIALSNKNDDKIVVLVENLNIAYKNIYGNEFKKISVKVNLSTKVEFIVIGYKERQMIQGIPLLKVKL